MSQTLPSGIEVTYSLSVAEQSIEGTPPVARGLRTVEWDAFDPNGDLMSFDLYVGLDIADRQGLLEDRTADHLDRRRTLVSIAATQRHRCNRRSDGDQYTDSVPHFRSRLHTTLRGAR